MNHERPVEFPIIEIEKYLKSSLELNDVEKKIQKNIIENTPDTIIDLHTHTGLPIHARFLHKDFYDLLNSTYPHFSFELHRRVKRALWGDQKTIKQAVFAFPFFGVDIKGANEYIQSQKDELTIPFLTGVVSDLGYTIREIESGRWCGVKMYPHQQIPKAQRISEFYPPRVIDAVAKAKLPLIVHLPKDLFINGNELKELAKSHPFAKFIVAHAGNIKEKQKDLPIILGSFKETPNVFFDTSCVTNMEVLLRIMETLGIDRVIFGSDQPLNLIRAVVCSHPQLGYRFAVDTPYHWANPDEQKYYKESLNIDFSCVPNLHFGSLDAIIRAVSALNLEKILQRESIRKIFYQNALQIFSVD
jgi:hypothetical protein